MNPATRSKANIKGSFLNHYRDRETGVLPYQSVRVQTFFDKESGIRIVSDWQVSFRLNGEGEND